MKEEAKDNEIVFDDKEIENLPDAPMKTPSLEDEEKLYNEINDMFEIWKDRYEDSA